jgi:hypothetical protein
VLVDTALSFDLGPEDTGDSAPRFDEDVEADSDHIGGDAAVDVGIDVRLDSGDDPDLALGTLIGPDGGVLDFEFARVIIPPGALEEPVRIALVVDGVGIAELPPQFSALSLVVGFLRLALEFAEPVEISIAFSGTVSRMDVWWLIGDDRWRPLITDVAGRWSSATVSHFGQGFVGRPTSPYCGDGAAEGDEACDGVELLGAVCEDIGFVAGPPVCTDDCELDFGVCDDPCEGVSCTDPPLEGCVGPDVVTFGLPAECVAGECVWTETVQPCGSSTTCLLGDCVPSP